MNGSNFFMYDNLCNYPLKAPYHPERIYSEFPFKNDANVNIEKNDVYRMVRELFIHNNMDEKNFGTNKWNPLGKYIKSGDTVLLKPNLVSHCNPSEPDKQKQLDCLITHPSVVRVLFDYTYIALKGRGKIIIADAPVQGCDFEELKNNSGYGTLIEYLKTKETKMFKVDFADLRDTVMYSENGKKRQRDNRNKKYEGVVIDLKEDSYFNSVECKKRLRITDYAASDTVKHHNDGKNEYCISEVLLKSDVIINVSKPKTHRIAGYTAALKNLIGINTRKEYLPHHRRGMKKNGGDEYTEGHVVLKCINSKGNDIKNWALKNQFDFISDMANAFSRSIGIVLDNKEKKRKKFGMWYGNDTIWRTILDVNHIVCYCGNDAMIHRSKQRQILNFGDMIVCGEQEGPLRPTYKRVGGILFSDNAVEFDMCVVKLMGFDYREFPVLVNALQDKKLFQQAETDIFLNSNDGRYQGKILDLEKTFEFIPSSGWINLKSRL